MPHSDKFIGSTAYLNNFSADYDAMKKVDRGNGLQIANLLKTQAQKSEPVIEKPKPPFVVGIDFDGTCVMHEFPKVGKDCPHAVEVIKQVVAHGAQIVLFTMRSGQYLADAIMWFQERNIPLYGINKNPTQDIWTDSPKAYCNLYIDDAGLGCPLIHDTEISKRPFVDWLGVDRLLQKQDWFIEPIVK